MPQNNRGLPSSYTHCYLKTDVRMRDAMSCDPFVAVGDSEFQSNFNLQVSLV